MICFCNDLLSIASPVITEEKILNNLLWCYATHFDKANRRQQGKDKGLMMEGQ